MLSEDSKVRFSGHIPTKECVDKMYAIRKSVRELAVQIETLVPKGREQARALSSLEDVMFQSNAGISRVFPIDPKEV